MLWKEEFDPSDDLTKLLQYAGVYSATTIDKASEVSSLLKTKDQDIFSLQAQLSEAQQKAEQAEQQLLVQQQINNCRKKNRGLMTVQSKSKKSYRRHCRN